MKMKTKILFNPTEWGVSEFDQKIIKLVSDLEKERKSLKLSQKEVALLAGISQGQLSRIENLESIPSLETIYKIASALKKEFTLVSIS